MLPGLAGEGWLSPSRFNEAAGADPADALFRGASLEFIPRLQ